MRDDIETAPRDRKFVNFEDDAGETYDAALESSNENRRQEDEVSSPSRVGPSAWRRGYNFCVDVFAAAVLIGGFFYVVRGAGQADLVRINTISGQVIEQGTQLPGPHSMSALPALPRTETSQLSVPTEAQQATQVSRTSLPEARQSLKEERTEALAQEFAESRRAIEQLDVQLQAEAVKSAQSLERERQKTAALEKEAAAARLEQTTNTAQHRRALDEETARSAALASELATALRKIETLAAELSKARDDAGQLKQAAAESSAQWLEQERQRTAALEQEAAGARQALTASTAQHRQTLDEERARRAALWSELAVAQREIETQAAQLRKASDETGQLRQAEAEKSAQLPEQERQKTAALAQEAAARQELSARTVQLRHAIDEERERSAALANELASARREIETQAAQLRKTSDETALVTQAKAANSDETLEQERKRTAALTEEVAAVRQELTASLALHRQAIDEERARSAALAGELATVRRETETQAAQLRKASDEAALFKQVAESATAELRKSQQRVHDRTAGATRDPESARQTKDVRVTPELVANSPISGPAQAVETVVVTQPAAVEPQTSTEATRLVARASALLGQGDIGAARAVLERAAEAGSAHASFMLAETYDPGILSAWGTYGTRGEATKARELYAKAHAGGIQKAKDRFNALRQ
jgi:hypothetical protein